MSLLTVPCRNFPRPADEERHPERLLVHEPLVVEAVLAEEAALVGGVDHDRLAGQSRPVEVIEQAADVVVDRGDAAQVGLDEPLILRLRAGLAAQVPGLGGELGVLKTDLLLGQPQGPGPPFTRVEQRRRLRDRRILVELGVLRVVFPLVVGRLVVTEQEERAILGTSFEHAIAWSVMRSVT